MVGILRLSQGGGHAALRHLHSRERRGQGKSGLGQGAVPVISTLPHSPLKRPGRLQTAIPVRRILSGKLLALHKGDILGIPPLG